LVLVHFQKLNLRSKSGGLKLSRVVARRTAQYQYCQLLIKMAIRCGKGGFIYLGEPPIDN
jgi:hypothetical protein